MKYAYHALSAVVVAASLSVFAAPVRADLATTLNPFNAYYNNIPRAAQANDVGKIRSLLSDGTSPNQTDENGGTTGMHVAAASGNLQIIAILYKAGGDVNQRDAVGSTPLDYAAEHDRYEAAKLLVEMKTRINDQNKNGMTALMFAAKTGDIQLVHMLLDGGANPNTLDYTGRDAAGWAVESHRQSVVQVLKDAEHKH
jgi:ankyrin repeat protein